MPVDERKVKEMLRHQHEFREKIEEQVRNYESVKRQDQFQYGLLLYVAEAAYGEMKELMNEVSVRPETLPFINWSEKKKREGELLIHPGDR